MTEPAWIAVDITLPAEIEPESEALDILSGALFERGAGGIETRDAARPIVLVVAFPDEGEPGAPAAAAREALFEVGIEGASLESRPFEAVDWATHWKQHFHPIGFGPLWIVPTWLEPPPEAVHVLRIDPGMAFGTGLHATTAMCLERIVARSPVEAVLDVGTGTGILGMAALLLGAERALATDNDPEALAVAKENAELNALAERLGLTDADPGDLAERFPLVVANILAGPLVEMAPRLAGTVAPGGRLVLSGILAEQGDEVVQAYLAAGLVEPVVYRQAEWVCIELAAP